MPSSRGIRPPHESEGVEPPPAIGDPDPAVVTANISPTCMLPGRQFEDMSTADRSSKVPSGTPGLDSILHGGFLAGHTTSITGGPGTGTTSLALQFLAAADGVHGTPVSRNGKRTLAGTRRRSERLSMTCPRPEHSTPKRSNRSPGVRTSSPIESARPCNRMTWSSS